jgi:hypothetical protein
MHGNSLHQTIGSATLAALTLLLPACSDSTRSADPATATAAPAAVSEKSPACWAFTPGASAEGAGWYPVRNGVAVTPAADGAAMNVSYVRTKGKPAGVAFHLTPGASERLGSIALRMSARPEQRLSVCLTDGQGVVWTFPTIKALGDVGDFMLSASEIKPDPFQNAGKQVPARPDWSSMRMLTILDITGFMGAPEAECSWRIEFVRGEEGER